MREGQDMTILVTGGSGFLGAWIIRRLQARGLHVRVFDRRPDPTLLRQLADDAKDVDWIGGDIADGSQSAQPHVAPTASFTWPADA